MRSSRLIIPLMFVAACQFDGEFSWNPKYDAGTWHPYQDAGTGNPDSGAPVSGHGGSGGSHAGQSGSESKAGHGGSEAGSGGMCGAGAGAQGGVGGSDGTSCNPACSAGQTCCNGSCVDLMSDVMQCGACGNACSGENMGCCGGQCTMLTTDTNCGGCGKDCSLLGSGCSCREDRAGWLDCRGPSLGLCSDNEEPIAGSGGSGDPPIAGSGDDDPPVAGGAAEGGSGGVGEPGSGGVGGEPQAGSGGEPQAGSGGDAPPVPLHDLEVTAFTITNQDGALFLVIGDTAKGSVTFHNPNDVPFPLAQIVIAGRPPGGTNAGGPYLDLIPTLGGPTTIAANGDLTYSATRTMVDSDPLGTWRFYPTWNDTVQWHDGTSKSVEVKAAGSGECGNGLLEAGEDCEVGYLNSSASNCDFATCKRTNYLNCSDSSVKCPTGTACLGTKYCMPTSDKNCVTSCPEVPGIKVSCAQGICYLDCTNGGKCPSDMSCNPMSSPDGTLVTDMCFAM